MSLLLLAYVLVTPAAFPQESPPKETESEVKYEFFSGTVASLEEGEITVSRSLPGRSDESRSFIMNSDTVIEGKLRAKVRVTVGYTPSDDGDVALRIIVRSDSARK